MADNLGEATLRLTADTKGLQKGLDKVKGQMRAFGTALTAVGGAAIAPLAAGVKIFAEYEQNMANVRAVSGATAGQFAALDAVAKQMGATTVFTARESAQALSFMAMAGMEAEESVAALPDVLSLAAAGQLELGQSADIVTNVMAGYGIAADEVTGAVDVLTKGFTSANTDLVQLGEAFKMGGPVAKAAGLGFEETAAALALMGNAGFQGTLAGTALRGAITRLLNPTDEAAGLIEQYGVTVLDAQGNMMPLASILKSFEENGLSAADAMTIFGQRAGPGMLALIGQGTDALTSLTTEMENSGGTAQRIADTQLNTLSGQFTLLKSALEGLALSIGEQLMPPLRQFVEFVTPLIQGVIDWAKANPELTRTIVIAAGAAGALALVAGTLLLALSFILGPIGLVALGLAALVAAGVFVYQNWDVIRARALSVWASIYAIIGPVLDTIVGALRRVAEFAMPLVREAWEQHLKPTWSAIVTFANEVLGPLLRDIGGWFVTLWGYLDEYVIGAFKLLLVVTETVWKALAVIIETALGVVTAIIRAVLAALSGDWQAGWQAIKDIGEEIWEGITGLWKVVTNLLVTIWAGIRSVLGGAWRTFWNWILSIAKNIYAGIRTAWHNALTWMVNKAVSWGLGLREKWDSIWASIANTVKRAVNKAIGFINGLIGRWNGLSFTIPQITLPTVTIGGKFGIPEMTFGGQTFGGQTWRPHQIPPIPALAQGGIVRSPTLAMIGERGPEAVIPLGRGGGGGLTINVAGSIIDTEGLTEAVAEALLLQRRRGLIGI